MLHKLSLHEGGAMHAYETAKALYLGGGSTAGPQVPGTSMSSGQYAPLKGSSVGTHLFTKELIFSCPYTPSHINSNYCNIMRPFHLRLAGKRLRCMTAIMVCTTYYTHFLWVCRVQGVACLQYA